MGEINRGGLPDLNLNFSKSRGGLPDLDLDFSKSRGGLPDLDLDPTRLDFCQDIIPLEISRPYLLGASFCNCQRLFLSVYMIIHSLLLYFSFQVIEITSHYCFDKVTDDWI